MQATTAPTPILEQALRLQFEKAKLPSSPTLATEILELANDPDATAADYATVIQPDAALAARLLQMANAAHFAQRTTVTTITRAVTVLGARRVRTVALSFQLASHLDHLGTCSFDLKSFWQHSLLRACVARALAARVIPARTEEAFLVGLLQDCGILVLTQILGDEYAELYQTSNQSHVTFHQEEKQHFAHDHVEAIATLASLWHLPEIIAVPLAQHHEREGFRAGSADVDQLSAVACCVGLFRLAGGAIEDPTDASMVEFAETELGLSQEQLGGCLLDAADAYREMAPLLSERLPDDPNVADLLNEANRQLCSTVNDAEREAVTMENERDLLHLQQAHLQRELGEYRERAARDPLTGLLNRAGLLETARSHIDLAQQQAQTVTVFFFDLDDFKQINDRYGHATGDAALQAVGDVVGEVVSDDGCAGRYGGEEFVVVVLFLDPAQAQERAQRAVERIRMLQPAHFKRPGALSCSLGVVWARSATDVSAESLFATADSLMYRAKCTGKDRCCWSAVESLHIVHTLGTTGPDETPIIEQGQPALLHSGSAISPEELRVVLQRLERQSARRFKDMRKTVRRTFAAPCKLNVVRAEDRKEPEESSYVTNVSKGGLGLLSTRSVMRGDPVEVVIDNDGRCARAAGLVAFCRHVEGPIYEIGVQVITHARESLPASRDASAELDWLSEALTGLQP